MFMRKDVSFAVLAIMLLFLTSCQTVKTHASQTPKRLNELKQLYNEKLREALGLRNPFNGWLVDKDCDAILWTGKYGTTACPSVQIGAAEFEPGRFGRRPSPRCYDEKTKTDNGAKSTWSRDMAMGLFAFTWKCGQISYLERHRKYGVRNNWVMGKPFGDGRVLYSPQVIAMLHEIIFRLGGDNSPNRALPSVYPKGLTDYKAHLQVLNIWLRNELEGGITQTMYDRLTEHRDREPHNPFYNYMVGIFNNDQDETVRLLLDPAMPMSAYVRCKEMKKCKLAEWLFVANLILEDYK